MNEYDLNRQKQKQESQKKIIEAAILLFGKNGYAKTSIKDVADKAGVANGLVSKYFPTKEVLLSQCYKHATAFSYPEYKHNSARESTSVLIQQTIEISKTKPEYYKFFSTLLRSSDLPQEYTDARRDFFVNAPIYNQIVEEQNKGCLPQGNPHDAFIYFIQMVYSITDMYIHTPYVEGHNIAHKTIELVLNTMDKAFYNMEETGDLKK